MFIVHDASTLVKFELTAVGDELAEHDFASEHARFGCREGDVLALGYFFVWQSCNFGQADGFAIGLWQELNHGDEPASNLTVNLITRRRLMIGEFFGQVVQWFFGPVVIDNGVACDSVHPALEFLVILQGMQMFVHFEKDILQDVFGKRSVIDPAFDEAQELVRIGTPEDFGRLHGISRSV